MISYLSDVKFLLLAKVAGSPKPVDTKKSVKTAIFTDYTRIGERLFPVIRGFHTQMLLYVAAEIGGRREAEHIGNLYERKRLVTKLT